MTKKLSMEIVLSNVLRVGVLLAIAIISFGVVLSWLDPSPVQLLASPELHPIYLRGLTHLAPNAVVSLGLMVLVALPVTRVGLTVLLFLQERDYFFSAITAIVFLILLGGLFLGTAL